MYARLFTVVAVLWHSSCHLMQGYALRLIELLNEICKNFDLFPFFCTHCPIAQFFVLLISCCPGATYTRMYVHMYINIFLYTYTYFTCLGMPIGQASYYCDYYASMAAASPYKLVYSLTFYRHISQPCQISSNILLVDKKSKKLNNFLCCPVSMATNHYPLATIIFSLFIHLQCHSVGTLRLRHFFFLFCIRHEYSWRRYAIYRMLVSHDFVAS